MGEKLLYEKVRDEEEEWRLEIRNKRHNPARGQEGQPVGLLVFLLGRLLGWMRTPKHALMRNVQIQLFDVEDIPIYLVPPGCSNMKITLFTVSQDCHFHVSKIQVLQIII